MSTDKDLILTEFKKLPSEIVDFQWLDRYINFCINNRLEDKIPQKTSSHHILPVAKSLPFEDFSDLSKHEWNKAELYYSDHYYAHYLLHKAISHFATIYAFTAMHNKDKKLDRITEHDLIPAEEFDEIWDNRNEKISKNRLEIITIDGKEMSKAKFFSQNRKYSDETKLKMKERFSGENNPTKNKQVVEKIRETKSKTFINGKNLDTISAENAAKTMKNPILNEDGILTTIYKENGKKISSTYLKIESNGKTKAYNKMKKIREKMIINGKWYIVKNYFDPDYHIMLPAIKVREISPGLDKCTKDKFLGKSKYGQTMLTRKGKKHLIGLYVEEIQPTHEQDSRY